jgi:prepilin-type N-terminal cleavage/methylation domain-containing protein
MSWLLHLLKSKKGVTLIELLAVIVILGIIAAVTIPMVAGNQDTAKSNANDQNLKIVQDAVQRYMIANNGNVPTRTENSVIYVNFAVLQNTYLSEEPTIHYTNSSYPGGDWPINVTGQVSLPDGAR